MHFGETEDRRMFADTLRRYLEHQYTPQMRAFDRGEGPGFHQNVWKGLAELGIIGALFSESAGGFGGEGFDISTVFEQLGYAGVVEPFLPALYAGSLIAASGDNKQQSLLNGLIEGKVQLAFAHTEPESRYDLSHVATTAETTVNGFVLNGTKSVVINGGSADYIIVSARTSRGTTDEAGISLFLVPANTEGLQCRNYAGIAGGRAAEVTLTNANMQRSALLGQEGQAFASVEQSTAHATLALCSDALGAMEMAKSLTIEYLRTRQQFGKPIGKFQALQHRMVDVLIQVEQTRSAVINLAEHLHAERHVRERHVSATKNLTGRAAQHVAEECIQMHGGIGMTQDYALAHYARRLIATDHLLGDTDYHLERFIQLSAA